MLKPPEWRWRSMAICRSITMSTRETPRRWRQTSLGRTEYRPTRPARAAPPSEQYVGSLLAYHRPERRPPGHSTDHARSGMSERSIAAISGICRPRVSAAVSPVRRRKVIQGIVTVPCLRTLGLFHFNRTFRLALHDRRLRLLGSTFDFSGRRSLPMMREQSCRHLADNRRRRRLVGSQARIGGVLRLQERVEPKRE